MGNFDIVIARSFNHIGPGQSERFAVAEFARQIAAIKLGLSEPPISAVDIDTTRDFTDVRDVVLAYGLLLGNGKNGETYNVCSGEEYSIRHLIEKLCISGGVDVELKVDSSRMRRSDQRRLLGRNAKNAVDTGWPPNFLIDQTAMDILRFWIQKQAD